MILLSGISLLAVDYNEMKTEELMKLRGSVPVEDIEVYASAIGKRVQVMSEADLKKYGIWEMIKVRNNNTHAGHNCTSIPHKPIR